MIKKLIEERKKAERDAKKVEKEIEKLLKEKKKLAVSQRASPIVLPLECESIDLDSMIDSTGRKVLEEDTLIATRKEWMKAQDQQHLCLQTFRTTRNISMNGMSGQK